MARTAKIERKTNETQVEVGVNLDGTGKSEVSTGIGFLDHMICLFAKQSRFDIVVKATGDLSVEDHHLVEDVGICLGLALAQALGEKRGINRYGFFILPMDDSLCTSALDLSGRFYYVFDCQFSREKLGELSTENIRHFWYSLAENARMNLNIKCDGINDHHKSEAIFKSVGRSLRLAVAIDPQAIGDLPSTKGKL